MSQEHREIKWIREIQLRIEIGQLDASQLQSFHVNHSNDKQK